jgi:iron complex transport system substrate-binding protein
MPRNSGPGTSACSLLADNFPVGLSSLRGSAGGLKQANLWAQGQSLKDDLGRSFPIEHPPQRIISLAPNITEILFALGLERRIVGVTRFCDYPPAALEKEKIGGLVDPSLEKIKALAPDLIIAFRGNPVRVINRLDRLRFPVFVLDIGTSLEALFPMVRKLGTLTHSEDEAERVEHELRARLGLIRARLGSITKEPKVFLFLHGPGLWTCGKESYLTDLIRLAGGRNVAAAIAKKWLNYNREQLLQDDPDIIIIMTRSEPDFEADRHWFSREAHLEGVRAVKEGKILRLDENVASRFGPRLLEALEAMARLLHPEKFLDSGCR